MAVAGAGGSGPGAGGGGASSGPPTADQLLALLKTCNKASTGDYATDDGEPSTVSICALTGAFYWQADMDIDCDGQETAQCNLQTDPAFQAETSTTDSAGNFLDAAALPYVVIPLPSSRWSYQAAGIELGAVVAVIYAGQVEYGVFGDEGPENIIGESSYAMAQRLGIDPDPSTGGTDGPVTYIVFPGSSVAKIEDHAQAVTLGQELAKTLLEKN
jgi:hypothetical protein